MVMHISVGAQTYVVTSEAELLALVIHLKLRAAA